MSETCSSPVVLILLNELAESQVLCLAQSSGTCLFFFKRIFIICLGTPCADHQLEMNNHSLLHSHHGAI